MAETVHLYLRADGVLIQGDSTQHSLGRENSIECLSYQDATERGDRRTVLGPVVITKRIDRSTPLLAKAAVTGQAIAGEFRFFRPSPNGDGTTQQYYTTTIEGRITHITRRSPDVTGAATAALPVTEEVTFACTRMVWRYQDGGIEFGVNV